MPIKICSSAYSWFYTFYLYSPSKFMYPYKQKLSTHTCICKSC